MTFLAPLLLLLLLRMSDVFIILQIVAAGRRRGTRCIKQIVLFPHHCCTSAIDISKFFH